MGNTRTVLITGASSGIGAALAREVSARGDTVALVARRADRLAEVLADCRVHAPESQAFVADLGAAGAPGQVAADVVAALGPVDVLVNNAAIPSRRHVSALTPAEVDAAMRVNFHAPVELTLALLPSMLERGAGTIVNVSSMGGRLGILREAAYCASKFALCGWSEALAMDLWETPLTVRLIIPGPVDTEIWDHPDAEPADYDGEKVPAAEVARGIADAFDSDEFEHFLPDMKDVALWKTQNIDDYIRLSTEALSH